MAESQLKRKRAKNLSQEDKERLFEILKEYKSTLNEKKSNKFTNNQKKKAWAEITKKFNESTINERTAAQLQAVFWKKLGEVRKNLAHDHMERFATGGGPFQPRRSDADCFASFCERSVQPMHNFDGDSVMYGNEVSDDIGRLVSIHDQNDESARTTGQAEDDRDLNLLLNDNAIEQESAEENIPRNESPAYRPEFLDDDEPSELEEGSEDDEDVSLPVHVDEGNISSRPDADENNVPRQERRSRSRYIDRRNQEQRGIKLTHLEQAKLDVYREMKLAAHSQKRYFDEKTLLVQEERRALRMRNERISE